MTMVIVAASHVYNKPTHESMAYFFLNRKLKFQLIYNHCSFVYGCSIEDFFLSTVVFS
jgi:hypothetical protein